MASKPIKGGCARPHVINVAVDLSAIQADIEGELDGRLEGMICQNFCVHCQGAVNRAIWHEIVAARETRNGDNPASASAPPT